MNRRHIIFILESVADECVCVLDTIYKVASALYHALIDKFAERLVLAYLTQVIKKFIPKTAVNKVTRSMLSSTYIQVYRAPVIISLFRYESIVIVRVHVAQIICR